MKRLVQFVLMSLGALLMAACAAPTTTTLVAATPVDPATALANLKTVVAQKCVIAQPFLTSMMAMQSQLSPQAITDLTLAQSKLAPVCILATQSTAPLTVADVQNLVDTGIPKLISVVDASSLSKQDKTAAELALTAAELAISMQLAKVPATATATSLLVAAK